MWNKLVHYLDFVGKKNDHFIEQANENNSVFLKSIPHMTK